MKLNLKNLGNEWREIIELELQQPYMQTLMQFLSDEEASGKIIYPPENDILRALIETPLHKVSVVIIGQDPYHGPGQAHGLSFSVPDGVKTPPSLKNIYKQIQNDFGVEFPTNSGNLLCWAKQGVLLINSVLTVEANKPGSHANRGWEIFTDKIVSTLNHLPRPIVFMLWGNYAKSKGIKINREKHFILESPHPSPFSAHSGFIGNQHFKKCNEFLTKSNRSPINWSDAGPTIK